MSKEKVISITDTPGSFKKWGPMDRHIHIADRKIGPGCPVFVIAEIGTNHNRDINQAKKLIDAACSAKADSVKFQIYEADDIVSSSIQASDYDLDKDYGKCSAKELFDRYFRTPKQWLFELVPYAKKRGLIPIATAHSRNGAMFIEESGCSAIKIASMDFNNKPVLQQIVESTNLPVILSTGMSSLDDIDQTLSWIRHCPQKSALLHCVSNYPPIPDELHLGNIPFLKNKFKNIPVGFSDHSITQLSSIAAVTLGACIIEKHITLDRNQTGPDHHFSTEPHEFKELVFAIRSVAQMVSCQERFEEPSATEMMKKQVYQRSLISKGNLKAGTIISMDNIQITRPGVGIAPKHLEKILGLKILVDAEDQTPLTFKMFGTGVDEN